jgi:hypothetical protein
MRPDKGTQKEIKKSPVTVVHACNLSYLGVSNQEDRGSKPACEIYETLSPKKKNHKKWGGADGVPQGVGPEFKSQYKTKERKKYYNIFDEQKSLTIC